MENSKPVLCRMRFRKSFPRKKQDVLCRITPTFCTKSFPKNIEPQQIKFKWFRPVRMRRWFCAESGPHSAQNLFPKTLNPNKLNSNGSDRWEWDGGFVQNQALILHKLIFFLYLENLVDFVHLCFNNQKKPPKRYCRTQIFRLFLPALCNLCFAQKPAPFLRKTLDFTSWIPASTWVDEKIHVKTRHGPGFVQNVGRFLHIWPGLSTRGFCADFLLHNSFAHDVLKPTGQTNLYIYIFM